MGLEDDLTIALSNWFWEDEISEAPCPEKEERLAAEVKRIVYENAASHLRARVAELMPGADKSARAKQAEAAFERLEKHLVHWAECYTQSIKAQFAYPRELLEEAGGADPRVFIEAKIREVSHRALQEIHDYAGETVDKCVLPRPA